MKLGDYTAALDYFEKSLDMAKVQNDKMAEKAIKHAMEDANRKIVKAIKDGSKDDKDEDGDTKSTKSAKSAKSDRTSEKGMLCRSNHVTCLLFFIQRNQRKLSLWRNYFLILNFLFSEWLKLRLET